MIVDKTYYPLTVKFKLEDEEYPMDTRFRESKVVVENPDGAFGTNLVLESAVKEGTLLSMDFRFAASEFTTSVSYRVQQKIAEEWVSLGTFIVFQASSGQFRITLNTQDWEERPHRLQLRVWFRLGEKIKYQEYFVSLEEL